MHHDAERSRVQIDVCAWPDLRILAAEVAAVVGCHIVVYDNPVGREGQQVGKRITRVHVIAPAVPAHVAVTCIHAQRSAEERSIVIYARRRFLALANALHVRHEQPWQSLRPTFHPLLKAHVIAAPGALLCAVGQ